MVHLLPATPRKYIYTYATEDMAVGSEFPDCYWTSFNFFEANEANRNLDSPTSQYIGSRWRQVQPPLRFGDLIVFSNPEGTEALHACTYVAADIVYTKNGLSLLRPFVLEPFSVVAQSYWNGGKNRVFYYRHRDAHTGNGANIAD